MGIFEGAAVAIVTPFNEDLSVNYNKLQELIDFQIENKTDAIVICGTTGECATLSEREHIEVVDFTCKHVNKRVPVIAGTGSNSTATSIELSIEAEKSGADGLLLVTPYYNKCTQEGLYKHFKEIAKNVSIPIILYNVPSRTGVNIKPETCVALCKDIKNIVAIKEASGDISNAMKINELSDGKVDIYSGNDDQIVPILAVGGKGVISVLSNICPLETHNICDLWFKGKVKESLDLQLKLNNLVDSLFIEVNPIPIKKAMNLMGMNVGSLRLPLTEMSDSNKKILEESMKKIGII